MPHATNEMVNGDRPQSKFISHLSSYPVVSDGVETFKSNPYGKKSLDLADSAYQRVVKPVEPHLETAYSYAKPYVGKADELGDSGLGYIDSKFPIVKEDTSTIVDKGKSIVLWPFKVAFDGKDYVVNTWSDEYQKTANHKDRGAGISTLILALISTELKIASDFFQAVADFLGPKYYETKDKYEETKAKGSAYVKEAREAADHYKEMGKDKLADYQKLAQEKAEQAKLETEKKAEQAKQEGEKKKEEAKKQAQK